MNGHLPGDVIASASEQVLKKILELYEHGLSAGAPGSTGIKVIADSKLIGLGKQIRKPRRKIRCAIKAWVLLDC